MFTLHLDLSLTITPLMKDEVGGIMLTRTFELPFAPTSGLFLAAFALNGRPTPEGFKLENVTWDADRQVFLADTSLTEVGLPLPYVAGTVAEWLERGWTLRSYHDHYLSPADDESDEAQIEPASEPNTSWEVSEKMPELPPRSRPKEFNKLLRALVREMVVMHNNMAVAYAVDQTKMFFDINDSDTPDTPAKKRFMEARRRYEQMPFDEQWDWRECVLRVNPRLDRIVTPESIAIRESP